MPENSMATELLISELRGDAKDLGNPVAAWLMKAAAERLEQPDEKRDGESNG